jgi:hypothetical protein
MRILTARWVFPIAAPPIEAGVLAQAPRLQFIET